MADDFLTKDRGDANVDLAAKETATGKLTPRSIITKDDGTTDINPATEEKQDAGNASLASLVAALADPATETTLADIKTAAEALAADPATATLQGSIATLLSAISALLTSLDGKTTAVNTGAVTVAGSALPTGAASETTLAAASAKLPAALGSAADSGSLSVAQSTESKALTGALTETAPVSDTASSGLNGRLQRIAQHLTSLIALLPTSLGPKVGASSLSVVEATPTTVTIVSLQTNATGTTYNAFGSTACEQLDIVNTAAGAVDLEVRRGGSGNTIIVPAGSSRMFVGLSNASGLQVRRQDTSNTQITFTAEAIAA